MMQQVIISSFAAGLMLGVQADPLEAEIGKFLQENRGGYRRDDKKPGMPIYYVGLGTPKGPIARGLDEILLKLRFLKELREVRLVNTDVSEKGIKTIAALTNLESLIIYDHLLTDA